MIGSIGAFFWWGVHFELFGRRIQLDWRELGHFGCMGVGIFGLGLAVDGVKTGLKYLGGFALLAGVATLIGVLQGNYS
jgi:hypothetical protein